LCIIFTDSPYLGNIMNTKNTILSQKDLFNNESGIEQFLNSLNFSSIGVLF